MLAAYTQVTQPFPQHIVNQGGAPMSAHGLNMNSLVGEFWQFFALGKSPTNVEVCTKVATMIEDKYGASTVGCLLALHEHNMAEILKDCNASPDWIRSIEHLTGMRFMPLTDNVTSSAVFAGRQFGQPLQPNSANMRASLSQAQLHNKTFSTTRSNKGKILKASNMLETTLGFDKALIDSLVTETKKPIMSRLTFNDSNAIATHAFRLACCRNMLSCDKTVFEFWAQQLSDFGYPCPDGTLTWASKFKGRFKNGRRETAKVWHMSSAPTLPLD